MSKNNGSPEEDREKQASDMSDRDDSDDNDDIIRNQDTRTRRAWVDRALQGVRRRLESGQGLPEADAPSGTARQAERPQLYVVPGRRKR